MTLFPNEVAIVTGAASNIGAAIALRLAREGADLILVDVDEERLRSVAVEAETIGRPVNVVVADLGAPTGWHAIAHHPEATRATMFVHAACPPRRETDTVPEVSEETFDTMMNVNVKSGFFLGRALGLAMQKKNCAGQMLFVTSLHAATPRNLPHYSASKAGMTMIMAELAAYFAASGIRVNALAPGAVPGGGFAPSSDFTALTSRIPMGRAGLADEIAASAMALLSNELTGYVTGTTLVADGGLQHFNWIDPVPNQPATTGVSEDPSV